MAADCCPAVGAGCASTEVPRSAAARILPTTLLPAVGVLPAMPEVSAAQSETRTRITRGGETGGARRAGPQSPTPGRDQAFLPPRPARVSSTRPPGRAAP